MVYSVVCLKMRLDSYFKWTFCVLSERQVDAKCHCCVCVEYAYHIPHDLLANWCYAMVYRYSYFGIDCCYCYPLIRCSRSIAQ